MKNIKLFLLVLFFNNLHADYFSAKERTEYIEQLTDYYKSKYSVKNIKYLNLLNDKKWQLFLGEKYRVHSIVLEKDSNIYSFYNYKEKIMIEVIDYLNYDKINFTKKWINSTLCQYILYSDIDATKDYLLQTNANTIGDFYNYTNYKKTFFRGNVFIEIRYEGFSHDANSEELFQLAKKIDHKICELNGIPYDPNFPEKEDNDSEEDKEVKRKIADGTYTKIEDLPKPQSQSDNVKNNVKNPQEEKTVTKIDSPISPKIENSKSKIFGILGILFTVVFGGFLLIYKKRKKKNKIKNTELNN